jgi:hypothetical protein
MIPLSFFFTLLLVFCAMCFVLCEFSFHHLFPFALVHALCIGNGAFATCTLHIFVVVVSYVSHIVGVAIIPVHTSCMPSVGILHISCMLGVVHLGCVLHMPIVTLFLDFFFNLVCHLQFMVQFL